MQCASFAVVERNHRLHRTLAERNRAGNSGAMVILQSASYDFGRAGTAAVHQHDDRLAFRDIASLRIETLRVLLVAASHRHDLSAIRKSSETAIDRKSVV